MQQNIFSLKSILSAFSLVVPEVGNIHKCREDVNKHRNSTKSTSNTIDDILSLDLAAYCPNMNEPDSGNQLHKCGEYGVGYKSDLEIISHFLEPGQNPKYFL